jgi:hypothetical protein
MGPILLVYGNITGYKIMDNVYNGGNIVGLLGYNGI